MDMCIYIYMCACVYIYKKYININMYTTIYI